MIASRLLLTREIEEATQQLRARDPGERVAVEAAVRTIQAADAIHRSRRTPEHQLQVAQALYHSALRMLGPPESPPDEPEAELPLHERVDRTREAAWARVREASAAHEQVLRLRQTRLVRVAYALVAVVALVLVLRAGWTALRRGPDLALGKPITTSSTYPGFSAKSKVVDGHSTDLLFHTQSEESPWAEVDLQKVEWVREVELRNRTDAAMDRARPLLIEVSTDRVQWQTVAQQPYLAHTWVASFARTQCRYVRVRIPRQEYLHLEAISIR